jgi:hypothetical protein
MQFIWFKKLHIKKENYDYDDSSKLFTCLCVIICVGMILLIYYYNN